MGNNQWNFIRPGVDWRIERMLVEFDNNGNYIRIEHGIIIPFGRYAYCIDFDIVEEGINFGGGPDWDCDPQVFYNSDFFFLFALHDSDHICFKPGFENTEIGQAKANIATFDHRGGFHPPRGKYPSGYTWDYKNGGFKQIMH